MEFSFTPVRIILLLGFLGIYGWLGGFTPPWVMFGEVAVPSNVMRGWTYCLLLFAAGAVSGSLVDHYVGNFPPSNLRLLYVILGVLLMVCASLWITALRDGWKVQLGA